MIVRRENVPSDIGAASRADMPFRARFGVAIVKSYYKYDLVAFFLW